MTVGYTRAVGSYDHSHDHRCLSDSYGGNPKPRGSRRIDTLRIGRIFSATCVALYWRMTEYDHQILKGRVLYVVKALCLTLKKCKAHKVWCTREAREGVCYKRVSRGNVLLSRK